MLTLTKEHASVSISQKCLEEMAAHASDFSAFFEEVCRCCNVALEIDEDRQYVEQICESIWQDKPKSKGENPCQNKQSPTPQEKMNVSSRTYSIPNAD